MRKAEEELDLWLRARWDIRAATRLRRRLARRAEIWDRVRRDFSGRFDGHPELLQVHELFGKREVGQLAELDATVRRIYGASDGVHYRALEAFGR
ncbi:MAG TPA: hypothetical protein VLT79_09945 [Gemmatimonadales bacterium]|nr:hypothetical protein [Gemmatimonadales bacterium]